MSDQGTEEPKGTAQILHCCLYFTANALARTITRMAEESFRVTGLSPSHAFLLMLVVEQPGAAQKRLAEALQLAPSTVTRMVDALVSRDLVTRRSSGRIATVTATAAGEALLPAIREAWCDLHRRYSARLGQNGGEILTRDIDRAHARLEE